ncbi:MAG: SPFH domain-containing protein [Planctomycetes bacterium]|nr:SPFH domain-containing protein [Planctomycetota bacterium]
MSKEFVRRTSSGWVALVLLVLATIADGTAIEVFIHRAALAHGDGPVLWLVVPLVAAGLVLALLIVLWCGFFTLQPNEAAVLLLFGQYKGTVRQQGFHWANPFYTKSKISLRTRNFNTDTLKVNDKRGNPVDIAAVVVWRVDDTAQASFDVDDYRDYVHVQSESALRHLASAYPYDTSADGELSLRGSMDEVSHGLQQQLQERLTKAGVVVEEARLSHLAYAAEIAGAMLRRQQAEAIVEARMRIVDGAVGMVEIALERLERGKTVELDNERKAAMVSNLLVVLCGEQAAQPVVNTGTLYS